jgi:pSer/pThr/pTyr-binding forkhead associated (FHA) protein
MAQKSRLAKDLDRVAQTEDLLKTHSNEVDQREKSLADLQQTLTVLSGSAATGQWKAFVDQLAATKREQEQRAARFAAEEKKLQAMRAELVAASAKVPALDASIKKTALEFDSNESTRLGPPIKGGLPPLDQPAIEPVVHAHTEPPIFNATPPPPPEYQRDIRKATLGIAGRRLHLFAGPAVRFGRHGTTDVLLVAMLNGQTQPTLALNREISRKHFEVTVDPNEAYVRDGWSDGTTPSQHGLCVDGRRVPTVNTPMRTGNLLSVTTRAPARSVPHWRVLVSPRSPQATQGSQAPVNALYLQRLDDVPDDILVVLTTVSLAELGFTDPALEGVSICRQALGFAWKIGGETLPFVAGPTPVKGVSLISLGWNSPTAIETPA